MDRRAGGRRRCYYRSVVREDSYKVSPSWHFGAGRGLFLLGKQYDVDKFSINL